MLLGRFSVREFYHFTDTRNLPSIRQHGLLSWAELQQRGIQSVAPGGNDWSHDADHRVGLDEYVHLCLMKEHPMEYRAREDGRIESSVFLRIAAEVLHTPGVLFTADVSNKSGVETLSLSEALEQLDLEAVYTRLDWSDPVVKERRLVARKYEILVPTLVPSQMISGYD